MFLRGLPSVFSPRCLAIAIAAWAGLIVLTAGSPMPLGLMVPMIVTGGCAGRLFGVLLHEAGVSSGGGNVPDPGLFALFGATSLLAGSGQIRVRARPRRAGSWRRDETRTPCPRPRLICRPWQRVPVLPPSASLQLVPPRPSLTTLPFSALGCDSPPPWPLTALLDDAHARSDRAALSDAVCGRGCHRLRDRRLLGQLSLPLPPLAPHPFLSPRLLIGQSCQAVCLCRWPHPVPVPVPPLTTPCARVRAPYVARR